jgi:anti-sigma-K factor RskA
MSTQEQHEREHDSEQLTAYVLGVLGEQEVRAVDEHIASCDRCRGELGELREMEQALGEVPPEAFIDGPPEGGDLLLQRTLRQARTERAGRDRRRLAANGAIAAAAAAVLLVGGVLIGQSGGNGRSPVALPATTPPVSTAPSGVKVASATDSGTGATMTVQVTPAAKWVRVNASVSGIPAGERCRLVIVAKDGSREVAGGWVVGSDHGHGRGANLDGSAAIAPDDVASVVVENDAGKKYVTASL